MYKYNLVAENPKSTVVSDYQAEYRTEKEYQSEAELERAFIDLLTGQAYDYLPIHNEAELVANLRRQLEKLNGYTFTNGEWSRFLRVVSPTKTAESSKRPQSFRRITYSC